MPKKTIENILKGTELRISNEIASCAKKGHKHKAIVCLDCGKIIKKVSE